MSRRIGAPLIAKGWRQNLQKSNGLGFLNNLLHRSQKVADQYDEVRTELARKPDRADRGRN